MNQQTVAQPAYADFGALVGYQVLFPDPGVAVLELELAQHHCNRLGTVHGGVILTLLDTAGMWACTDAGTTPACATASLSCSFMKAAKIGSLRTLRARGEVTRKGRISFASISVYAGEEVIAMAQGVYAAPAGDRS